MPVGRLGRWTILFGLVLAFSGAGTAEAMVGARSAAEGGHSGVSAGREAVLQERMEDQDAVLRERIEEISAVGDEMEKAQARAYDARARVGELGQQFGQLEEQIAEQDRLLREAREEYRERARAAYKGESLEGLVAFLGGWFGSRKGATGDFAVAAVLLEKRRSLIEHEEARQDLRNTRRQVLQKKHDYGVALEALRQAGTELRRREEALDQTIRRLGAGRERTEARLREARVAKFRASTGGGEASVRPELARDRIFAEAVEPIAEEEYMSLYRGSARMYGFGPDWYVLAAVGKVESDHGTNMGPSSAGAIGPMQFLPSTWETSGVDGNGDGVANIMDPEDAIPAAAGYLRAGGAPQDWYTALYSYNHADWYVESVLAVAEAYRRLAHDENVGPYVS